MLDRHLNESEKAEPIAPELTDAILRIEGVYDPTRVGPFGPAFRMGVRAGTASMNNVFADRWSRADLDPNVHYRVAYLAEAWLQYDPSADSCAAFEKTRPIISAVSLEMLSSADCTRIRLRRARKNKDLTLYAAVAGGPASVPIFAAPYPGARFSPAALSTVLRARIEAVREMIWFRVRGKS